MANRTKSEIKSDGVGGDGFSLKRWSRRKLEAARAAAPPATESAAESRVQVAAPAATPAHDADPAAANAPSPAPAQTLPNVESLSFDSDFSAFLRPEVDEGLKRKALAKLFRDPRFNVMDGLDVYIDDYSKPDPIPPEMLRQLAHCRSIFDPPRTRVNAQGFVEDIPAEELAAEAHADAAAIEDGAGMSAGASGVPVVTATNASGGPAIAAPGAPGVSAVATPNVSDVSSAEAATEVPARAPKPSAA
jgi:hypothetical protein